MDVSCFSLAIVRLAKTISPRSQVKPENILINDDGILKLCDFGIVHDLRHVRWMRSMIDLDHSCCHRCLGIDISSRW